MQKESEVFLLSSLDNNSRQRQKYRAPWLSSQLFNIFERSRLYRCLLFLVFTFAICVGAITTYQEYSQVSELVLVYIELTIFIYCSIEFLLRNYASGSQRKYNSYLKDKNRLLYEHYLIIDLILLISYGIIFALYFTNFYDLSKFSLHGLRFLQLLRFLSLDRHIKSIPLIARIIWQYRQVLLSVIYLCFLLLLPTAYLLWIVERFIEKDGQYFFKTYIDSLWFTINSMATIGYGDTWPQTLIGRALTATLCSAGIVLWTLPAGIISAGLTSINETRRESERLRRSAARLILAWWRLQTVNNKVRTILGKHHEKEKSKQFIARLLYIRLLREFQRCQHGDSDSRYDIQTRKDVDRILQCLHKIDEKLNNINQRFYSNK